jgi:hypothetical protein
MRKRIIVKRIFFTRNTACLACASAVVTSLFPLDFEPQEMGRAGDARIVIGRRLFTAPSQLFLSCGGSSVSGWASWNIGEIYRRADEHAEALLEVPAQVGIDLVDTAVRVDGPLKGFEPRDSLSLR